MFFVLTTNLLVNCENDSVIETHNEVFEETSVNVAPFSSRLVYSNEIENNRMISEKLRGLQFNSNQTSFENGNNDFTIATHVAKYVEKADGTGYSYTFAVNRAGAPFTDVENLVLSVNTETQELTTALFTYHYNTVQLQELLNTKYVSTNCDITVTPVEGDFSNLVPEFSTDPCSVSTTTYHITPDGEGTFVYGPNSQCQHMNSHGESDCQVYTVTTIWCPPTSGSNGTTTSTTTTTTTTGNTNNNSTSGDPFTNSTSGGGTSTTTNTNTNHQNNNPYTNNNNNNPSTNNNSNNNNGSQIVTTPLTGEQLTELKEKLNEKLGEGNWEFEDESIEGAPNFDSVDEVELYLQSLLNDESTAVSSNMNTGQDNIRTDVNRLKFSEFPRADFVTTVKIVPPAQGVAMEVVDLRNVTVELEGNISLFDWTQTDSNDPNAIDQSGPTVSVYPNISSMVIDINGYIKIGLNIEGNPIRIRKLLTISISYDYTTGEMKHENCRWLYR